MSDCTVWDNSKVFLNIDDPRIEENLKFIEQEILSLKPASDSVTDQLDKLESCNQQELVLSLANSLREREKLVAEIQTGFTYFNLILSADAQNEKAKGLFEQYRMLSSDLRKMMTPVFCAVKNISDSTLTLLLAEDEISDMEFILKQWRLLRDFQLSNSEEKLIGGFAEEGIHAWGNLYRTLAGNLKCEINGETVGAASTVSMQKDSDRKLRETAWRSLNKAWGAHEDSVAAILNNINGWRVEERSSRSTKQPLHYLDECCHDSHITRNTLSTLMDVTYEKRNIGHRALQGMAKLSGVDKLAPWDILAPVPTRENGQNKVYSFSEAMKVVVEAFGAFNPEMADFAQMAYKNNWINARPTPNRGPGAFCTGFLTLREPRVFQTFNGSMSDVKTLAHELGHAYHSWVMRDLPISKTFYAMTTAETASIFAETLVKDYLLSNCQTDEERLQISWQDAMSASTQICNISARYDFEKTLVETREQRPLSVSELKNNMKTSWQKWYGDSLPEYDEMFWASKLHFSISQTSFYNYPYLFGYLFSLGIYAKKKIAMGISLLSSIRISFETRDL